MNIKTQSSVTTTEALKMAIEAMERAEEVDWELNSLHVLNILQAIQACKEALDQSSWKRLSDDEIEVIDADCWVYPIDSPELFNHYKFARAIEAKSKEKNNV